MEECPDIQTRDTFWCRITAVAAGGHNTMVKTVGGTLLAFGQNKYGCLGVGDCVVRTVPTQVDLPMCCSPQQLPSQ